MEELTKQQIVLVTLLTSFITSIATGIVTVALMDQAPPGVTQTVNRVVERTIEKMVPTPNQAAAVITKETVVVKADDLVVEVVERNAKSLAAIFAFPNGADEKSGKFVANGLIVSKDGLIATDSEILAPVFDDSHILLVSRNFRAVLNDGTTISIVPATSTPPEGGLTLLKPISDGKSPLPVFVPASIADAVSLKLGQTVIALGGEKISVATGIVSNLTGNDASGGAVSLATSTSAVQTKPQIIKTDIISDNKILGSILINLSGDVVGINAASTGKASNLYLSAETITKMLAKNSPPVSR